MSDIVERLKNATQALHRPLRYPGENGEIQQIIEAAIVEVTRLRRTGSSSEAPADSVVASPQTEPAWQGQAGVARGSFAATTRAL